MPQPQKRLKTYRVEAEVTEVFIYETQAATKEDAERLFYENQCAWIGKGPQRRKYGTVSEVSE